MVRRAILSGARRGAASKIDIREHLPGRFASARKRPPNAVRLLMRTRHVNGLLIAAILVIFTMPLNAAHQQNAAKLNADARNVVGIIGGDRAKTQIYCQILDLARQLERAKQEKDRNKTKALSQRIDQLQKQLPEFVALVNVLNHVDLNTPSGREIVLIIESLKQSCE